VSHLILVVEDDTTIANWLRVFLEEEGFAVEVAHDGRTGLNLARSLAPDLIVLDLMLPLLDGMELCQILRRESDVPIIMLTAKAGLADRTRGLDTGADDYVGQTLRSRGGCRTRQSGVAARPGQGPAAFASRSHHD